MLTDLHLPTILRRRELMLAAAALAAGLPAVAADLPDFPRAAFDATSLPAVLKALGLAAPTDSADVRLQTPEMFEDGTVVPITVGCALPGVRRLILGIDRNPTWLAAVFSPGEGLEPQVGLRLKMQESSPVVALAVLADGRVLMARREVRITLGGCGGAAEPETQQAPQPTLIRVQLPKGPPNSGAAATVRSLMKHEMESGHRKDGSGRPLPAWHIEQIVASVNDQPVMSAWWGTAVSKNPFLQFGVRGLKPGDRVSLGWADNRGATRSDQVTVAEPAA